MAEVPDFEDYEARTIGHLERMEHRHVLIAVAVLVVLLTILVVVGILTRGGDDGSPTSHLGVRKWLG